MNAFRYQLLFFLVLAGAALHAQPLKEIYIYCDADEFDSIYENYQQDIYITATLTHAGITWTDVQLRLRGDSSREYPKKSLKVQFDQDPFINGKYTVNFNAEYHDLSYMHSVLSSMLFREAGIPAPEMEHVRLYLNGEFLGLYVMTENMDEQFLEANGMNADGILYKASRDGACLSIFDNVFYHWELNTGSDPYRALLTALIAGLNDPALDFNGLVHATFDYSNAVTFMAMNMLVSNGSTYYHNYFLFRDNASEKWRAFPWDLDRTFTDYGVWYPYHRSSGTWTPDNPLLERSIMDESLFADIRQKVQDLHSDYVNQDFLFPVIDSIHDAIAASVGEDITDNIPDLQTWENKIATDKEFIISRNIYLVSQFSHCPGAFQVDRKEGFTAPGQPVEFTWQASSDPDDDTVAYTFYFGPDPIFEDPATLKIEGITAPEWTIQAPGTPGKYYWMVEATDGNNVIQGFDTRNELFVSNGIPQIVINEINYNSSADFDPGDWVEFYNPGNVAVDLSGWKFMDENNTHVFVFPAGTSIGADGYLVLCRSTQQFFSLFPEAIPATGDMDFGLSGGGELIRLYDATGYPVDELIYRNEYPWPPGPDGNGPTLELLNPGLDNALGFNWSASFEHGTPGEKNGTFSPDFIAELVPGLNAPVKIYPNPCTSRLTIDLQEPLAGPVAIRIMDMQGREVISGSATGLKIAQLDTGSLAPGPYSGVLTFPGGGRHTFTFVKE